MNTQVSEGAYHEEAIWKADLVYFLHIKDVTV